MMAGEPEDALEARLSLLAGERVRIMPLGPYVNVIGLRVSYIVETADPDEKVGE
jgi:hypothetical protein